jgi:hypothetical protein
LRIFSPARMKVGDKIIQFRLLQNAIEGWHLLTALKNLCAYSGFVSTAAYSGKVGTPGAAAIIVDGVAVLAAVICINLCAPLFGRR